jgi:fermentation-respiration switch protein FrsA (DUF1100 family)
MLLTSQLEQHFIFFPTREVIYTPESLGLAYEDVYFTTADGVRLNGWYLPGRGDITWLWFHGNGGNISHRLEEMALLHQQLGVNLFVFDYRGYGRSQGKPSERGTYRDARAALEYLCWRPDLDPQRTVYFGGSLGAAIAVELATVKTPLGLILVCPFTCISDMARLAFPLLPVHRLVWNKYHSLSRIPRVHCPLLVIHGDQDDIVPMAQGQKLFEAANQPKQLHIVHGAGHSDCYASSSECLGSLASFLGSLPGGSSSSAPG